MKGNAIGPGGSRWRKWDMQVHTPASHLNNQFGDDWDVYVQRLFRAAIANDLAVIALTDYFTIDGYKRVKNEYLADPGKLAGLFVADEIAKIGAIRVLPNIEFRLNKLVGDNRINCHVILSDDVSIKDIEEHFLHDLWFADEAQPQQTAARRKLKVANLEELGARLIKEHAKFKGGTPRFVGMKNAVVDEDEILQQLQDKRFKDKYLFCVVSDEDLPKLNWNGQDHLTRKMLIQRSDALFTSNAKTRNWALGRAPQYAEGEEAFTKEFKTLKPCIHGSDCHGYEEIGHPCAFRGKEGHTCGAVPSVCELRHCWIKADTTFEGLRQIIHEPADRAYIGPSAPEYHNAAQVISSVSLVNGKGWFADCTIPLNPGMVSIIGQKGSGKSALADLIAFAAGDWNPKDPQSFLYRAGDHLVGMEIILNWADGNETSRLVGDSIDAEPRVRYLSQNYVERICAKDGISKELVREIEKVIFHYLDPTDTWTASDFNELRAIKTEAVREEGNRLRDEILSVIREHCAVRDQIAKRPEKLARIKALTVEREGLVKQLPAPTSAEEAKVQKELQDRRVELAGLEQKAASYKQALQRVSDVRTRVGAQDMQMQKFYEQIAPVLLDLGVPQTDISKFRPVFTADTAPILDACEKSTKQLLAALEGAEPPQAGTIMRLRADIEALTKLETADKAKQERTKQIQTRIGVIDTELPRLNTEIEAIAESRKTRLPALNAKRLETYVAYFENLRLEQKALQGLYDPIRERLSAQALLTGKELEFAIRWAVDLPKWLDRGSALFDQRRVIPYDSFEKLGDAARNFLLPAWTSGDPAKIRDAIEKFMVEFRKPEFLPWTKFMRTGVGHQDVLDWLYEVGHITLEYGLKFNGAELESLSPGTKGIVLLILYLGMDTEDTRPLIVDQPDENLDNESIYKLLTPYFRTAKVRRQVIVITHNPNLVVNSDSEQIIVVVGEKQGNGLPVISYSTGSLEDNHPGTGTRQQVCNILEGGDVAFRKRERRYSIQE